MLLQRRESFRSPCFELFVVRALCRSFEVGNISSVDLLKPLQVQSVKIPGAEVLRFNTAGAESDAFSVGQRC